MNIEAQIWIQAYTRALAKHPTRKAKSKADFALETFNLRMTELQSHKSHGDDQNSIGSGSIENCAKIDAEKMITRKISALDKRARYANVRSGKHGRLKDLTEIKPCIDVWWDAYKKSRVQGDEDPHATADKFLSNHLILNFNIIEIPTGHDPLGFIRWCRHSSKVFQASRFDPS